MNKFENFVHKSDLIFFSDKGESMSDAQSMKGKCTQISEDVKAHIESLGAVKEEMPFDGKTVCLISPRSVTAEDIKAILGKDADANALNAWYANAITAKKLLLGNIKVAPWTQFLEGEEARIDERYTEEFTVKQPTPEGYDESSVLSTWSADKLADYYLKEQFCATIGKLIHRKGKLHELYTSPLTETTRLVKLEVSGGRKDFPVTASPVYVDKALTDIKELYLETHDKHRDAEKQLNFYKATIKNEVAALNIEAQRVFSSEMDAYDTARKEYKALENDYLSDVRAKNTKLQATAEIRRQKLMTEASNIKIFMPENLRGIKKIVQEYVVIEG